jgi:hypothetical protein
MVDGVGVSILSPAIETTTDGSTVDVTAAVRTAHGVTEATCNGRAASVVRDRVQCLVDLRPGRNDIVVHVFDSTRAQGSDGVTVMRRMPASQRLLVGPQDITLGVGDRIPTSALDHNGQSPLATWMSSDPTVVDVCRIAASSCPLTARAPGTAVVTATHGGRSGTTRVTVTADRLAVGAIAGRVALPDGLRLHDGVGAHRVAADGPDSYLVLVDSDRNVTLQGLDTWGAAASMAIPHARVPLEGWQIMGDNLGGVVMTDGDAWPTRLVRASGSSDSPPWRYHGNGRIESMSQSQDGTIYVAETASDGVGAWLVVLDGQTGSVRARLELPVSERIDAAHCGVAQQTHALRRDWTMPLNNGLIAAIAVTERRERTRFDDCRVSGREFSETLWLIRVFADQVTVRTRIHQSDGEVSNGSTSAIEIGGVVPDPMGGFLTIWRPTSSTSTSAWQISRVTPGRLTTTPLPLRKPDFENVMMTNDHFVVVSVEENRVVAIDPESGALQWAAATSGELLGVRDTETVLRSVNGTVEHIDAEGQIIKVLDGVDLKAPNTVGLVDDKLVISLRQVADWPYYAGLARPLPSRVP